jgi:hypothetical protein
MTDIKDFIIEELQNRSILENSAYIPLDKVPDMAESLKNLMDMLNKDQSFDGLARVKYNKKAYQKFQKSKETEGMFRGNIVNAVGEGKEQFAGEIEWAHLAESKVAVNALMSVLSYITSQYYLYEINKNLDDINNTVNSIESFLETEKRSKIESKDKYLDGLFEYYTDIQYNPIEIQSVLTQLQQIEIDSFADYRLYTQRLKEKISQIKEVKKQDEVKKLISTVSDYISQLWCSLYLYARTKYLIMIFSGTTNEKRLSGIQTDLEKLIEDYEQNIRDFFIEAHDNIQDNDAYKTNDIAFGAAKIIGAGAPGALLKNAAINEAKEFIKDKRSNEKIEATNENYDTFFVTCKDTAPIRKICDDIRFYNIINNQPVEIVFGKDEAYIKFETSGLEQ